MLSDINHKGVAEAMLISEKKNLTLKTTTITKHREGYFSWWKDQFIKKAQFSSVQFSHSVVSDSLRLHESQHARPPCPSPTPGVYSNSCPSSWWCHPAISSSVVPFSSCPQFLPASGPFLRIRWPKYWSFSFSISPSNEHPVLISFRMDWLDLLAVQGTPMTPSLWQKLKRN